MDDKILGVAEGLNAGCWAIGVAAYSNYTNVDSFEQWNDISETEKEKIHEIAMLVLIVIYSYTFEYGDC